jgi:hypothetical protein
MFDPSREQVNCLNAQGGMETSCSINGMYVEICLGSKGSSNTPNSQSQLVSSAYDLASTIHARIDSIPTTVPVTKHGLVRTR